MRATVVSTFLDRARKSRGDIAFRYHAEKKVFVERHGHVEKITKNGDWTTITWGEYETLVRRAAEGLRALGFEAKQQGAILSGNRYEWHVADIAIQACGGVTVPIYATNAPPQVAYIAGHSESQVIFV